MTFLHPLAWALAALALPLFAAYLWRKKIEARRVSSLLLLRKIAVATEPPRRGLSKPRHMVSFALLLLALVAAAAAIADVRRTGEEPHDVVFVLDTSASMGARDGDDDDATRLEASIKSLREQLRSLHSGDRVALVTTGESTRVRVGLTEDYGSVVAAARTVTAGGRSDASSTALSLADGICSRAHDGRIVLFTDGVGVGIPTTKCKVEVVKVGRDSPNAGISELSVRESDAFGLSEVHVAVTSSLGRAQRAEVAILAGQRVIDIAALDLPARGKAERLLRLELPAGAEISAELKLPTKDALPEDDTATVSRVQGGRVSAMLVSSAEKSFTAEALRLHPRVDLKVVKPDGDIPHDATFDLVVIEDDIDPGKLPKASHLLSLGTSAEALGLKGGSRVEKPELLRWAFQDPLFRYVDLQGVKVPSGTALAPTKEQRVLIEAEQGALALLDPGKDRELVYVGFRPHESDWVLRVGFVNFVANVVEWSAKHETLGSNRGVLSSTESSIDPPPDIDGANVSEARAAKVLEAPLFTLALLAAVALLVFELVVQSFAGARRGLIARFVAYRAARRARARQEDRDIAEAV